MRMTKEQAIWILDSFLRDSEAAEAYWASMEDHEEDVRGAAEEAEALRMAIRALGGDPS